MTPVKHLTPLSPAWTFSRLLAKLCFEGRPLTTRARWLNPFIFTELGLLKRIPTIREVEKPVFVVGIGRSGTTILGEVFSRHEHLGLLNEPKALWHSVYPNEDLVGNYTRENARYTLGDEDASEDVIRSAHRLYAHFLVLTGSRRVVDKYPEMIFRLRFIKAIFPDAKLVWIIRNGWDVVHSIVRWSSENRQHVSGEVHDWWGADRRKWGYLVEQIVPQEPLLAPSIDLISGLDREEDLAAVEWITVNQAGLQSQAQAGELYPLHYEALISEPERELMKLMDYLELERDEGMISFARDRLKPRPAREEVELSPILKEAFQTTMAALHYDD